MYDYYYLMYFYLMKIFFLFGKFVYIYIYTEKNNTTIASLNNVNYLSVPEIHALVFYFTNEKSRAISFAKLTIIQIGIYM